MTGKFPALVSYNWFVELQQKVAMPLVLFLKTCRMGQCGWPMPSFNGKLHKKVFGKPYVDRGYVSLKLAEILFVDGIHFVAKMRNNMKGRELPLQDRLMLRKRAVIESVNDELKNICQIEYTQHRCFTNFITNLIAELLAYSFLPKKPSIRVDFVDQKHLMLF